MTEAKKKPTTPAYYDFEMERRRWRRIVWGAVIALGTVSLVISLASILIAVIALDRPTPVVVFDAEGRPIVFTETSRPGMQTDRVRVKHFVKTFLDKWVCVDSTRIDRDVQESLAMMTRPLQDEVLSDGEAIRRRDAYRGGNVRSRIDGLEMRIGDFDPEDTQQKIGVYAWGKLMYEPIEGNEPPKEMFTFSAVYIDRTAVTEATPHGLLVAYAEYHELEDAKALERELIKRRQS